MEDWELFKNFDHIGVVVKDMEEAKKFYSELGVDNYEKSGNTSKGRTLYGEPLTAGKTDMQMGDMGSFGIQIAQPIDGLSVSSEFMKIKGEGVNHIAFEVDDIQKVTEEMRRRGYNIVFTSDYQEGGGEIHVDTGFGFSIQFFEGGVIYRGRR